MIGYVITVAGALYAAGVVRGLFVFEQARIYSVTSPRPSRLRWALRNVPLALLYPIAAPLLLLGLLSVPDAGNDDGGAQGRY